MIVNKLCAFLRLVTLIQRCVNLHQNSGQDLLKAEINLLLTKLYIWSVTTHQDPDQLGMCHTEKLLSVEPLFSLQWYMTSYYPLLAQKRATDFHI